MSDKNWIQKATKNMRKDKPCTGEKFGSETCPPGSKRYNLAKTFRKMAKEGHKLASLERASVLSASDDPKDQDKAREIRVRHDYENLKKQIGSKKKPDKPAVSEAKVDKGRSDYGKATIRNWRHSGPSTVEPAMFDPENKRGKTIEKRREEHKARRGVKGAKVPAYKVDEGSLHKWFKGSKSKDGKPGWVNVKTGGTCASDEPGEGTPKCVSSSKRASMTKAERESASRRKKAADPNQQQKSGAAKPTYVATDKKKKDVNEKCWDGYTQKGMKKKGKKVVPNCVKEEDVKGKGSGKKDACYKKVKASAKVWPSAYASGRLVQCRKKGAANYGNKSEEVQVEGAAWTKKAGKNPEGGLNEKGRKSYERENPGSDLKAPQPEGGSRKKSFCARMGGMKKKLTSSKTANDPDSRINKALRKWKCNETVAGGVPLTPQELEIQKKMSRLNVRLARKRSQEMQKAKIQDTETAPEQVKEEDKAFNTVVAALRKKHGKDAVITKDSPKPKPPSEAQKKKAAAERKKRQDADNKAYAARAKKAGFKSTQDYTNVVARYGSEDNYRKGKGLGT
jgi:hypothetical protein